MVRIVSWNVNGIRSNIFCEGSLKKNKKVYKELNASNLKNFFLKSFLIKLFPKKFFD